MERCDSISYEIVKGSAESVDIKNNHLLISFHIDYVLEKHKCRLFGEFYYSFVIICCFGCCEGDFEEVKQMGLSWKKIFERRKNPSKI